MQMRAEKELCAENFARGKKRAIYREFRAILGENERKQEISMSDNNIFSDGFLRKWAYFEESVHLESMQFLSAKPFDFNRMFSIF